MKMIKINLLEKKKAPAPFGLDEFIEKLGLDNFDFDTYKPILIKLAVLTAGIYLADYGPTYYYENQLSELDAKLKVLSERSEKMQKELAAKKEVRKEMEQLIKEEAETRRQLDIISNLSKERALPFKVLDYVSGSLPHRVWIDKYQYGKNTVSLEGEAWDYVSVNEYIKSLGESSMLQAVTLRSVSSKELAGPPIPGVPIPAQKLKAYSVEMVVRGKPSS